MVVCQQFQKGRWVCQILDFVDHHEKLLARLTETLQVKSLPISFPDTLSQCIIKGRFDAIIAFDDGSYGIIDYKTSDASEEKAAFYSSQLSAYAYALENPAPGALSVSPITRLGLFIITPNR